MINEIDPMNEFSQEGYEDAENSTGYAGGELVDSQWSVMSVSADAEEMENEKRSLRIHVEITLAPKGYEKDAMTPGRRFWDDFYVGGVDGGSPIVVKKGSQQMLDAFLIHAGVGTPQKRFSEDACHSNDTRIVLKAGERLEYAKMIAGALKGKIFIGHVGVQKGGKSKDGTSVYNDKNKLDGHYRLTDENLEAIRGGKYSDTTIAKKTRTTATGKKETFLSVKVAAAGKTGGNSSAGNAGGSSAPAGSPRTIGA